MALPISVDAYHKLGESGIIPEKTELLAGVVVEKMTKDPRHSEILQRIFEFFLRRIGDRYRIRKEDPLTLQDSEPEPDLAVVPLTPDGYFTAHPATAYLVIEVSNRTLHLDREKAAVYAGAGIPEYWTVNLTELNIEVYSMPRGREYRNRQILAREETIQTLFDHGFRFRLADVL